MMRLAAIIAVACLLALGGIYAWWSWAVGPHIARVEASIAYHQQQLRQQDASASLSVGSVSATGFPLKQHVRLQDVTLATEWGGERYSLHVPEVLLSPVDAGEGRYRVELPPSVRAVYRSAAIEQRYDITPDHMPALLLRAQGDSRQCMNMPGSPRCADVAVDAPLISFAVQLPARWVLTVQGQGGERKIGFQLMPVNIPIFQTIPAQASHSLQLLVGMLQEAYLQ